MSTTLQRALLSSINRDNKVDLVPITVVVLKCSFALRINRATRLHAADRRGGGGGGGLCSFEALPHYSTTAVHTVLQYVRCGAKVLGSFLDPQHNSINVEHHLK